MIHRVGTQVGFGRKRPRKINDFNLQAVARGLGGYQLGQSVSQSGVLLSKFVGNSKQTACFCSSLTNGAKPRGECDHYKVSSILPFPVPTPTVARFACTVHNCQCSAIYSYLSVRVSLLQVDAPPWYAVEPKNKYLFRVHLGSSERHTPGRNLGELNGLPDQQRHRPLHTSSAVQAGDFPQPEAPPPNVIAGT